MKYEKPVMKVMMLEAEDIITLSVGGDDYDPEIKPEDGKTNPWQS